MSFHNRLIVSVAAFAIAQCVMASPAFACDLFHPSTCSEVTVAVGSGPAGAPVNACSTSGTANVPWITDISIDTSSAAGREVAFDVTSLNPNYAARAGVITLQCDQVLVIQCGTSVFSGGACVFPQDTLRLTLDKSTSSPSLEDDIRQVNATVTTTGNAPAGTSVALVGEAVDLAAAGHDHFNVSCLGCLPATTTQFLDFHGSDDPVTCTLDSTGQCTVTLQVPLISGIYKIVASLPDGTTSDEQPFGVSVDTLDVLSQDILSANTHLLLTGQFGAIQCSGAPVTFVQSRHENNHFGADILINDLLDIADEFYDETGLILRVNDMSVLSGGLFDIGNNWSKPHKSHRFGVNADIEFNIGSAPACTRLDDDQREILEGIILDVTGKGPLCEGGSDVVDCRSTLADRYHLNKPSR